ncbi:MAG: hypothetical protein KC708_13595, partial [Anaerolineae bacterium]|nr:hypothetical protein [Anaerolineae bacterium]
SIVLIIGSSNDQNWYLIEDFNGNRAWIARSALLTQADNIPIVATVLPTPEFVPASTQLAIPDESFTNLLVSQHLNTSGYTTTSFDTDMPRTAFDLGNTSIERVQIVMNFSQHTTSACSIMVQIYDRYPRANIRTWHREYIPDGLAGVSFIVDDLGRENYSLAIIKYTLDGSDVRLCDDFDISVQVYSE